MKEMIDITSRWISCFYTQKIFRHFSMIFTGILITLVGVHCTLGPLHFSLPHRWRIIIDKNPQTSMAGHQHQRAITCYPKVESGLSQSASNTIRLEALQFTPSRPHAHSRYGRID
ncbi:hypothetical protein [Methylobacillus flagellatus]|uniref:Uncharacterized protein n=1 Tax=Methylobacillus flagellatus (strain ATCC 51484 / DSM 6875 / VKM B-1610 / KT) TaxID=265072 RepID=Q1GZ90_METFK|nr:hypothetical protein [Methylobacillus flagellatus]ABE50447.1 hypothetical protein Mfla_2180 [Methylobacillus flagellatus KT]